MKTIEDVRLVALPRFQHENGELVVVEGGQAVPFAPVRMFTVKAGAGALRGCHAHKACSQFMMCVHGVIKVECDDGAQKRTFVLDSGSKGLLVPPGIWASETYEVEGAVLSVLCDRPYEAGDYLREYDQFLAHRRAHA